MLTTGLRAWVLQRLSAVYMTLFILWMLLQFLFWPPASFEAWRAWVANPFISIAIALFFASLLVHAWVGTRDVLMDYISSLGLRTVLLAILLMVLMALELWTLLILFSLEH